MLNRKFRGGILFLMLILVAGCARINIPSPDNMADAPSPCAAPESILSFFEGIPYRGDGAINRFGDFTLFAQPDTRFEKPGLNCSGFTVAASRYFLKRNFALADMTIDRLADSGVGAADGQDWDFGYDLILNVTQGMERKVMLPYGKTASIKDNDGMSLRGFNLHDRAAWADVISSMRPGNLYLFSMNKPVKFKNYKLLHYHVGVIVPDGRGHIWLCHATTKGGVNKVDIAHPEKLNRVIEANPETDLGPRSILIIETPLCGGLRPAKSTTE
ncbi:hypothetical protein [Maridesulfovibrio hydrothermalis]|uniref:Uncharacterized protein n=1 Tax=Maridesulfovibrio hydrothermalis AM13 = DSM 14728 TaxID=1121451 RepID=L0RF94_9BACT|nr:hypothetical protein [Maridesulfovibrio hydrothermalis]CCO25443.1 conserved protein of unknown function [Maridesulfovibrio hydrothermalis AM13 = DSM 14728]